MKFIKFLNEEQDSKEKDNELKFFVIHFLKFHGISDSLTKVLNDEFGQGKVYIGKYVYGNNGELVIEGLYDSDELYKFSYKMDFEKNSYKIRYPGKLDSSTFNKYIKDRTLLGLDDLISKINKK